VSTVKYIISIKDSEGCMLVSTHAPTVYAVWRINRKWNISYRLYFQPNLTEPNLNKTHPILSNSVTVCTTENTTESRSSITNTFQTLWRSEIRINLKIDADALNRRWRHFCVRRNIYHIYQRQRRLYAGKCACAYSVSSVRNKIENETYLTDCTSNLT
jgi:hypothetical protein